MTVKSAQTIQSINPANKDLLGEVELMAAAQVEAAVELAWQAFKQWRLTSFAERANKILKFHSILEKEADQVAKLVSDEMGKPLVESYLAELSGVLDTCIWLSQNAEDILKDEEVSFTNPLLSSKASCITYEPLGVIGIISPWNYPFSIPTMSVLAALMTGNTVVLKPSEKTPLVGMKIGELFQKCGFPHGAINVVTGDKTTGEALTHSRLSKIIFTGSAESGSKVIAQAAANLIPVTAELGGKDAAIVLPDAPAEFTAKGLVWGALTNCGQACASIERAYVVRGANTDKLLEQIEYHTRQLKIGPASDPSTEIGPIVDEIQLLRVVEQVEQARGLGANIVCGGKRRDDLSGYFYEPTMITNVDQNMDIISKETFGPILPIMIVDSEDEAIAQANNSDFGLTASIWSSDRAHAEAIARKLNVGTVYLNDCLFSHAAPQVPWGGVKHSGMGRSHARFGLMDLVNIKHISKDAVSKSERFWWFPYGQNRLKSVRGGIKFLHGSSISARVLGCIDFVGNMFKRPR